MTSLISGDNTMLVWMVVAFMGTAAVFCEQKFKWGGYIGSCVLAIFMSMILCSLHITPTSSPVYSAISGYVLPLSIPLLLFKCDVRKILRESGKLFILWHVAAVGTLIAALGGGFLLFYVPEEKQPAVMEAMKDLLHVPFRFEDGGTRVIHYTPELYDLNEARN